MEQSEQAGSVRYYIDLLDHSLGFPRDIAQEFVARGHAMLQDDEILNMFSADNVSDTVQKALDCCVEMLVEPQVLAHRC